MRTQQRKQTTILYIILALSILLTVSTLIYAIYSNQQLTKQNNQLQYAASLSKERINGLESEIEDLSLNTESYSLETETKVESDSKEDISIFNKPVEQKESQPVKETPAVAPKPVVESKPAAETKPKEAKSVVNDTISYTYTVTSVNTLEDGSKGYEATSKDSGSMSFTGDSVENSPQLKVGDKVISEFDLDGGLNRTYKK